MDALKDLVTAQGCAVDGVGGAANPLTQLVSGLASTMPAARGGHAAGAGQRFTPAMFEMHGDHGAHPDDFAAHARMQAHRQHAQHAMGMAAGGGAGGDGGAAAMRAAWQAGAVPGGGGPGGGAMAAAWAGDRRAGAFVRGGVGGAGSMRGMGQPQGMHMGPMGPMGPVMAPHHMGGMMGGPMMHPMAGMMPPHGGMAMHPPPAVARANSQMAAPAPPAKAATATADATPSGEAAAVASAAPASTWAAQAATQVQVADADGAGATAAAATTATADRDDAAMTRDASRALAEALRNDPTFKDSALVDFMTRMGDGEIEIAANKVVPGTAPARVVGTTAEGGAVESKGPEELETPTEKFEHAWLEAEAGDEVDFSKLMSGMQREYMVDAADRQWWEGSGLGESMTPQWVAPAEPTEYTLGGMEDNPYKDMSDAFERGMRLFDEGKLHDAVMAFEAVVAKEKEHSEAWRMLGQCHAENDEDKKAILCLERAVEEDPYNLDALVGLGVSYVNELDYDKSLAALKAWVTHNPKFHGLKVADAGGHDAYGAPDSKLDDVMHLMLKATAWDPSDPEVQIVLGVLYNVSRDYDSAIAAFQKALHAKPDDYSLWNKLGATRANSNRSEQAVPAYRRALELKPTYARGWLNLGISHANLGHYRDAARAYIAALKLNPGAEHIWTYLRIALTCLKRSDLVQLTQSEDVGVLGSASFDL